MNLAFLLAQRDEQPDWARWIVLAVFFGLPLLGKVLKELREGSAKPKPTTDARRELRQKQRQQEDEGGDLWRRLARGEVSAPPPPVAAPVERPAPRPAPTVLAGTEDEAEDAGTSLELEEEPRPLGVLGEVSEPAEVPTPSIEAASLETEEAPVPLSVLGVPRGLEGEALSPVRGGFALSRRDLRRAIVLNEVLGPPVSERALRA